MKLWGGRFTKTTDAQTHHFHSSISFDARLYRHDILGSIAHAKMLGRQNIIPQDDAKKIVGCLHEILRDIESGNVEFDEHAEDIHMNIEQLLTARIGESGKRVHTGRSRNDQVALDMRMYVKEQAVLVKALLLELIEVLNGKARRNTGTIMPGYTHLQRAQPVTAAHHMLAYIEMFKRDISRLDDCFARADVMPLGAGALAGTTYPVDREFVREQLGFSKITLNSLDSVSDRDFCIELVSALSLLMMHLSRFCEELVLWSSFEFKFVEIDDAYATGSSIMPQKKNPDMAELVRGKSGRVFGSLISLLTMMKGLPLAYNKDMQEDKEAVFNAVDTVLLCLPVFTGMVNTMIFLNGNMRKAVDTGFLNATDAADWLVKNGMAFRDAHEVVGRLVLYCTQNGKTLEQLSLDELCRISPVFTDEIYSAITPETCVTGRSTPGGPAPDETLKVIAVNDNYIARLKGAE